jgi:OOP family OmpA-OmpF porin
MSSNLVVKLAGIAVLATMMACASGVKKADIADTANPQEEISRLDRELVDARSKDVDVLSKKEFKQSEKALDEAKENLADGKKQEKTLDNVRFAQAYLTKAEENAAQRRGQLPTLFEARQAAIKAGAWTHPEIRKDFENVDEKVSDKSEDLMSVKTDKITEIQSQYVDLERRSVVLNQLGTAMAKVKGAKKDNAEKKAPNTLKKAEVDLQNAESLVSTNVKNPSGYADAVSRANMSSTLLLDVVTTINQNGKKLPEATALKLVSQNKKINGLQTDLASSEAEGSAAQAQLNNSNKALNKAQQTVDIQKALESARKQFPSSEAEAYQQGPNLVIRLKNMNFTSGGADLPAASLELLAKVSDVAKSLNAKDILVEGHTDSLGAKAKNEELSKKRAEAVASYFKTNGFDKVESEGYGFSKPLASNKTKAGRAQNRRVDITITPASATE